MQNSELIEQREHALLKLKVTAKEAHDKADELMEKIQDRVHVDTFAFEYLADYYLHTMMADYLDRIIRRISIHGWKGEAEAGSGQMSLVHETEKACERAEKMIFGRRRAQSSAFAAEVETQVKIDAARNIAKILQRCLTQDEAKEINVRYENVLSSF